MTPPSEIAKYKHAAPVHQVGCPVVDAAPRHVVRQRARYAANLPGPGCQVHFISKLIHFVPHTSAYDCKRKRLAITHSIIVAYEVDSLLVPAPSYLYCHSRKYWSTKLIILCETTHPANEVCRNLDRWRQISRRTRAHTKTPETWGLWRLILEGLAVLIECCVFQLLSGLLPVRTGDRPFSLAFQLTFDLRLRSTFQLCLPTQPSTRIGRCILWLLSNRSPTCADDRSSSLPSCQSKACAFDQLSSYAFQSASDLRRLPTFRLLLQSNLRFASTIGYPDLPWNPTSDSDRCLLLRCCLPIDHRLSSTANHSTCL